MVGPTEEGAGSPGRIPERDPPILSPRSEAPAVGAPGHLPDALARPARGVEFLVQGEPVAVAEGLEVEPFPAASVGLADRGAMELEQFLDLRDVGRLPRLLCQLHVGQVKILAGVVALAAGHLQARDRDAPLSLGLVPLGLGLVPLAWRPPPG